MDRKKVIKGLKHCLVLDSHCDDCPYYSHEDIQELDCERNLRNDAIAMMKEQDAVEARKKNDDDPRPWTSWWYVCGDCGQEIDYHDKFCRWCGRPVKWND